MAGTLGDAVLLLADASGFSRTCADLVAGNLRGADVIGGVVRRHVESISRTVEDMGGTIVGFSGDAISALWPCGAENRTAQLALATEAGLRIVTQPAETGDAGALRFRVAIDCGPWLRLPIGETGERGLHGGPLFERMGALSRAARTGRVALSPEARSGLGGACRTTAAGEVHLVESLAPAAVPPAPPSAPATGRGSGTTAEEAADWSDEICAATVLFLRYPTLSTARPEDRDILRRLDSDLGGILATYGGSFIQCVVDDKGLVTTAAWGIAQNRSEADAHRAILAAMALQATARDCGVPTDIGVSSGRVFAGTVGRGGFRVRTVLGAAVNRCAWLMLKSEGRILVDGPARDQAAAHVELLPADNILFKGGSAPEPCYTPGTRRSSPAPSRGRMVGRQREIDALDLAFGTRPGAVVWITGEAGIGKSHLVEEARHRLAGHGLEMITGAGDSLLRNTPLGAWQPILRGLLPEPEAAARRALEQALADLPDGTASLPTVAATVGIGVARQTGGGRPAGQVSVPLLRLLAGLAERTMGQRRVVLCFEDAHWLDTASWQLLGTVKAQIPSLGIVLVNRPVDLWDLPEEARSLYSLDIATHVQLGPLDVEETRSLLCETLGAELIPEVLVRQIQARSEGHPYYAKELAAALRSRGSILVTDRHCHIRTGEGRIDDAMFPETIEVAIAARFAELGPAAQLTLKVASVGGRSFESGDLATLHPQAPAPEALAADLAAARALSLIEDAPGAAGTMRFHHALTRDTIYGLMTDSQRQVLHRRVAEAQERAGAARDPDRHAVLAYHWAAAGEAERAIALFDSAAEQAARTRSHLEQVALLSEALRLDATLGVSAGPAARGRWLNRIARAYFHLGNVSAAVAHGELALSALVAPMPRRSTMALRAIAELWKLKSGRRGPSAPTAPDRARLLDAAQTCIELSFNTYELGDLPRSIYVTFLGANLANRAGGPSAQLAVSRANLSVASLSMPFLLDGPSLNRSAIEIAREVGDPSGLYWIGINASTYAFATGAIDAAERLAEQAIEVSARDLEPRDREAAMSHKANFVRAQGQFRAGFALDTATLASARDRGVNLGRMWGLNGCCRSLIAMGDLRALVAHTEELAALLGDPVNVRDASINQRVVLALSQANIALAAGDLAATLEGAARAAQLMSTVAGPQYYLEDAPGQIGDLLLQCWQADPGLDIVPVARLNVGNARKISSMYPVGRYRLPLARGDLSLFRGDRRGAQRYWQTAGTRAATMAPDLARAHVATRLAIAGRWGDATASVAGPATLPEPPAAWLRIVAAGA